MIKQLVCLSLAASVVRVYSLGALVVRIKSWLVCSLHSWFYAHAARFHVLPTQMRNDKMQDNWIVEDCGFGDFSLGYGDFCFFVCCGVVLRQVF